MKAAVAVSRILVEAYDRMSALQARIHNIQVQLLLTSRPFLASQHPDNSILHIFLTSPPYSFFFFRFSPRNRIPLGTGGRTVFKKGEYRIKRDPTEIMG